MLTDVMHEEQTAAPAGHLSSRAHSLLAVNGHPLSAETLIEHVFGFKTSKTRSHSITAKEFWQGQLVRLLKDERLFTQYSDGTWGLTAWGTREVPLDAMEYVVVDCETTGLDPNKQRVIEIAALRCRGGQVLDRFSTLIDPQRSLPLAIQRLTGITPEMLRGAPGAPEAIGEFLEFAGADLLVGHNVRFDHNFLSAEALRHHSRHLLNPTLCTIRLARAVMPGLRRVSLGHLAAALELSTHDRHRALGDAMTTQQAFWLLAQRAQERGAATAGRLLAMAGPGRGSAREQDEGSRGRALLSPLLRKDLPDRPGVYLMKDEDGTVIYVGKAKSLRKRIGSYYSQPLNYKHRKDGKLEEVRAIETRIVGSELEALILESRLIKELQPRHNLQLKSYEYYPFIKVDVTSPFPRVFATRDVPRDGARYFGPFRSKRAVDTVVDLVHHLYPIRTCTRQIAADGSHRGRVTPCFREMLKRCMAPCKGGVTSEQYHAVVSDVIEFLSGGQDAMLARVEAAMFRAADNLHYEQAARLRDALQQARRLLLSQELLTGAVEGNNLVIASPSVREGAVELFGIRHGRLFEQFRLDEPAGPTAPPTVWGFLSRLGSAAAAPPHVGKQEVDAIIIISQWLGRYGASPLVVRLPTIPDGSTVEAIVRAARHVGLQPVSDDEWFDEEPVAIGAREDAE